MTTLKFKLSACAISTAALLAACGGGGTTPDTTAPTLTITDNISVASLNTAADVTFTFTFNEAVTGFTTEDIVVTGGTKGTFNMASNGLSGSLIVSPTANTAGTINVSVASSKFTDASGNLNTVASSASQDYNLAPVAAVSFASGYTAIDASTVGYAYQGLSTEGGAFNWTVADGGSYGWGGADFWWSGVAPTDATPNFYWGGKGKSDQAYMESWVNAPANGTVSLSGQTKLRIAVWGNDELVGSARFTPIVQLAPTNGCYPRAEASPLTPTSSGAQVYNIPLNEFTITENCGIEMTTTAFFANPVGSIRVRIYKANYYNPDNNYGSPNGINLGPISFQP
ncbi:Ig-like domain-containing protein [Limnohabitans sp. 63ED37-2]|uniref:Ig-like domain-containing protein n=1 Tax=Limnohabitans sp. 63ED37-2 TaxID=1678128 RepID=UPI0007063997|nr:Ig-like domain-containing protein [Limnohabitans sp. 63ED37-2]ALK90139.1 hypothetical protein L63ED372_02941 [Limnohabitans sp. 63ED37-2]